MKKIILFVILSIFLASPCFAGGKGVSGVGCGYGVAAGEAGCTAGTTFSWNGDHTSGTTYGCDSAGSGMDASVKDYDTISSDYVAYDASSEDTAWAIDSTEMDMQTNDQAYTIFVSFYIVSNAAVNETGLLESYNGSEYFYCKILDADTISCRMVGPADQTVDGDYGGGFAFTTWYRVGYTFEPAATTGGKHDVSIVTEGSAASWSNEAVEDLDVWVSALDDIILGTSGLTSVNESMRLRDLAIIDGYQQTDPKE